MPTKTRKSTERTAAQTKVGKPATPRRNRIVRHRAAGNDGRQTGAAGAPAKRQTKKAMVAALVGRTEGASVEELTTATGWQAHSVRAALTGLRKAGQEVTRSKDEMNATRYCMVGAP